MCGPGHKRSHARSERSLKDDVETPTGRAAEEAIHRIKEARLKQKAEEHGERVCPTTAKVAPDHGMHLTRRRRDEIDENRRAMQLRRHLNNNGRHDEGSGGKGEEEEKKRKAIGRRPAGRGAQP